jgi:ornithine cyclodeaminase/alanine dehydrogenase-like protein (mu-crystallin family)
VAWLLREEDVERVVDMDKTLAAVEAAMVELGQGVAQNEPRRRVYPPGGVLNVMFASYPGAGYSGFKAYTIAAGTVRFLVSLFDLDGALAALIEANLMGSYRTGAATGVAARALTLPGPKEVAVIGTGFQARTQVLALARAIQVSRFRIFGRDAERREAFVEGIREHFGVEAEASPSAEAAVRDAQVVVCMTNSAQPVISADWVAPGALVVGAGINIPTKSELPPDLATACETVVVDQLAAARLESGDLLAAEADGKFSWEGVQELGAVLAGKSPGRLSAGGTVLFESHGLALWDVAAGAVVLKDAREAGLGHAVPIF